MAATEFRVERLADHHERRRFTCGEDSLDRYLWEQAGQDERRDIAACFVLIADSAPLRVLGYYTLSTHAVAVTALPAALARRLPKYGVIPTILLGRLAVDRRLQGQGIGTFLRYDAFRRILALRAMTGVWAVVVDALDERAAAFYRHQEFEPLPGEPLRLFLPLRRLTRLIGT